MVTTIAKKKKEISLEVIGGNAEGVTGSCTKVNSSILNKIKSKSVEMIIVGHLHCDHVGLIPMLFARGNTQAKIIVPENSTSILKEMWYDCCYINKRDIETLNRKGDKS